MQSLVVPKARKPRFDVSFKILDLNNIPYVSGKIYVKWHIPISNDNSDRTSKAQIKDHKAVFEYEKTASVRLVVDKNNWLQESIFLLQVIHEVPTSGKEERSLLGIVKINLAEYVEASRMTQEPITRRYLLQESRINSTLKVALRIVQTEGDWSYMAPQLKSAPQFVGIAGVIAGEQEHDDSGPTPTVNNKSTEAGDELRELYRKTLAAELYCQPGEPNADQVIEDIFAGGDGWCGMRDAPITPPGRRGAISTDDSGAWSEGEARGVRNNKRSWPDFQSSPRRAHAKQPSRESLRKSGDQYRGVRPRGSFGQLAAHRGDIDREATVPMPEVDELEEREDLRCWLTRTIS